MTTQEYNKLVTLERVAAEVYVYQKQLLETGKRVSDVACIASDYETRLALFRLAEETIVLTGKYAEAFGVLTRSSRENLERYAKSTEQSQLASGSGALVSGSGGESVARPDEEQSGDLRSPGTSGRDAAHEVAPRERGVEE